MDSDIQVTSHEQWTELRLTRPERRNAISPAMADKITYALEESVEGGRSVVVLCADGPIFCAGADLKDRGEGGDVPVLRVIEALLQTRAYVIAEVEHPALGAGVGIVAVCSAAVCSQDAWFALPEGKLGFFPHVFVNLLDGLVPPRRMVDVALGRARLSAAEANAGGLVSEVVSVPELRKHVLDRVEQALGAKELAEEARKYWQGRMLSNYRRDSKTT